ncbi:hypothetical protein BG011_001812 [Mortierella polycephala]|uniref:Uncharacterized protein n=1 Tax=Mortierella polycephala TaxID=41804 RepID=A0A9P6PKI3_9FUNG|nr:hypothetical protein BG011_001812 [Mortierella polycephala]
MPSMELPGIATPGFGVCLWLEAVDTIDGDCGLTGREISGLGQPSGPGESHLELKLSEGLGRFCTLKWMCCISVFAGEEDMDEGEHWSTGIISEPNLIRAARALQ